MSYISDKIAEVRGAGYVIPKGMEEIFLAIETEIGLDKKQPKSENKSEDKSGFSMGAKSSSMTTQSNPLAGERIDT